MGSADAVGPELRRRPFSLLVKPVSADCNLRCSYCFYCGRPTDPYAGLGRHLMSDETLAAMVRQAMDIDHQQAVFGWQGGEPLLAGLDFFRRAVQYQKQFGYSGQRVSNGLQTNGLLLNGEWAEFLRRYQFLVGLSLDGPAELHDHYRRFAGGHGSHERVLASLTLLRQRGVEYNILAVVNAHTAEHPVEIYDYFLELGAQYLQFIPAVEVDRSTGRVLDFSVRPEQYGEFLCRLFDRWYNHGAPEASERLFEAVLGIYLGHEPPLCILSQRCGSYVVVEYNGDVYPCDFFVESELRLGNLHERALGELGSGSGLARFGERKATPQPGCNGCRWLHLCHQGCPRMWGIGGRSGDYLCAGYKLFFEHSEAGFQVLARRLRAQWMTPAPPGQGSRPVGRNDPCPCGSGRKYKHCCMSRTH